MSSIKILAGDYPKGTAQFSSHSITLPWQAGDGFWGGKSLKTSEIGEIDIASEESIKRIGGTVGWGAAGAVILGPVGLLAGLLLGGKSKEVTFVVRFKDGTKMLATADSKTYTKLVAASMG